MASSKRGGGKRAVFDMETNGFLGVGKKIHCISLTDFDTGESHHFGSDSISTAVDTLNKFRYIIGHNICGFDIPYLQKVGGFYITATPRDTLVMSKLFNPERESHSLEFFGEQFGIPKPVQEQWEVYDEHMKFRCDQDVAINVKLYKWFIKTELSKWKHWIDPINLEQEFQMWQVEQELAGVDIDQDLAYRLVDKIDAEVIEIDKQLKERLPKRIINMKDVNKPFLKSGKYSKMTIDWYESTLH